MLFHELVALPGDDTVLAVVTVMVPGVSFADVVRTCATGVRSLSFAQTLLLVSSCFGALAQAQEAFDGAFVHQDLKPSNIVFESDPFDVASDLLGEIPQAALIDLDYSFLDEEGAYWIGPHGTPGYLAPELLMGEGKARHAHPASDVFSLGVLAHEALCGSLPYLAGAPRPVHAAMPGRAFSRLARARGRAPSRWTMAFRTTFAAPSGPAWRTIPRLGRWLLRRPSRLTILPVATCGSRAILSEIGT
ncbi:MAG: protein kinase domain-containing protein [Collinsella sp.]